MTKKNWRKPVLKVLSIMDTKEGVFNFADGIDGSGNES